MNDYNTIAENEKLIRRILASINLHTAEIDVMLRAYRTVAIERQEEHACREKAFGDMERH